MDRRDRSDIAGRDAADDIVGRDRELSALDELAGWLADGRGGLVWVQGEPGVGKSALIDAALAQWVAVPPGTAGGSGPGMASAAGWSVFRAAGEELKQPFPLRLMGDCLQISASAPEPAARQVAALLRGEPDSLALDPVLAAAERMLELVDRLCARGPVVLIAEDLQWSDEPSLLVWSRLARAVDQIPLLLIGAARPLPQHVTVDRLRDLVTERAGLVIDLAPLAPGGVTELAGRITGAPPGPRLQAALRRAGGNPLYVRELVEALVREGSVTVGSGTAELAGDVDATPASLRGAIGARLGFMTPPIRTTMQTAALLGAEIDAAELAAVTGTSVTQLSGTLSDAVAGGVVSASGPHLRFRHELIRQILVEETPATARPSRHGEIARRLAQAGFPVDSVARHLLAGPEEFGDWSLDWLAEMPESALHALPLVSADLLGRGVQSAPATGERSQLLAARLAVLLLSLGRTEQAEPLARRVIGQTPDQVLAARMRILLIRAAGRLGRPQEAVGFILASPGDDGLPPAWRSRLGAWSALILDRAGRARESDALAAAALAEAIACGDPLSIAYARHACICCGAQSRPEYQKAEHMRAALEVLTGQDPESAELRLMLLGNQLELALSCGVDETTEAALHQALPLANRAASYLSAYTLTVAAMVCYRAGRWDEALGHLDGIDPEFADAGPTPWSGHGLAALIALRREDGASADAHLRAGLASAETTPVNPLTQALAVRAATGGDLAGALTLMSDWVAGTPDMRPSDRPDAMTDLVRVALLAGDTAAAEAAARQGRADAAADDSPGHVAAAEFCAAQVAGDPDRLLAVAAEYERLGWVPPRVTALEEAAVRLAAAGDAARARAVATEAIQVYTALGATCDIRRTDARLRDHGVRRGPRSIRPRARTGWAALTPSEVRIAEFIGRGLSNSDIAEELVLSRRTVQTHVSNILAKLQGRSRIDIMDAARRQHARPERVPAR